MQCQALKRGKGLAANQKPITMATENRAVLAFRSLRSLNSDIYRVHRIYRVAGPYQVLFAPQFFNSVTNVSDSLLSCIYTASNAIFHTSTISNTVNIHQKHRIPSASFMHRTIFSRMGRTGQTLRSHSSPQHGHNTPRLHPYAHRTTLLQTPTAQSQPSDTYVSQSSCQSDTRIPGIIGSDIAQASPNPIVQTPATETTAVSSSSSAYMDDNWSPFDSPLVQECIASRTQSLPSLLEHKNHTPLYTPSPNTRVTGSAIRNPSMFATTYAGHVFANEQINMRIVDLESGEYLQRFPVCQRDAL